MIPEKIPIIIDASAKVSSSCASSPNFIVDSLTRVLIELGICKAISLSAELRFKDSMVVTNFLDSISLRIIYSILSFIFRLGCLSENKIADSGSWTILAGM